MWKKAVIVGLISSWVGVLIVACVPISASTAVQIPGTYDVTFDPLVIKVGGVGLSVASTGVYKGAAGGTILDCRTSGCLTAGKPAENTICLCEEFNICPQVADTAIADVKLPNLDQKANNKVIVDVTIPGISDKINIEGFMDGRKLDFVIGLKIVLEARKVGKIDCVTVEQTDVTGQGVLKLGQFDGGFTGRAHALWAAGCKFGPIALAGALSLERAFKATKR